MLKETIPVDVEIFDVGRTLGEKVYRRFSDHELGQRLKGSPRFHSFMPEGMNPQEWINTISLDGDNLQHMQITHDIMAAFIKENEFGKIWKGQALEDQVFTEEEKELLLFTALIHDIAESETGDKPDPEKTKKDHEEEMRILSGMLYHFMGDDLEEIDKINMIGDAVAILSDQESRLGKAFRAVEVVGYTGVAFKGWNELALFEEDDEEELQIGLRRMSQDVILGDIPKLIRYAEEYPFVKLHLKQNQNRITNIIAQAYPTDRHDVEYIKNITADWGEYRVASFR